MNQVWSLTSAMTAFLTYVNASLFGRVLSWVPIFPVPELIFPCFVFSKHNHDDTLKGEWKGVIFKKKKTQLNTTLPPKKKPWTPPQTHEREKAREYIYIYFGSSCWYQVFCFRLSNLTHDSVPGTLLPYRKTDSTFWVINRDEQNCSPNWSSRISFQVLHHLYTSADTTS